MDLIGIDRNRLRLEWISSAEGSKFAQLIADFTGQVQSLGKSVVKVPEVDREVLNKIVHWMEAMDSVSRAVSEEEVPPSKEAVFSLAHRLSVPKRARIPEAESWITADPLLCVGCRICEAVCSEAHEGVYNPVLARLHIETDPEGRYPQLFCKQDICKHCTGADCVVACPNGALNLDPHTGARYIDPNLCTGCRSCQEACQWSMITYVPGENICIKCDLCGGDPECVKACPAGALKYVTSGGTSRNQAG